MNQHYENWVMVKKYKEDRNQPLYKAFLQAAIKTHRKLVKLIGLEQTLQHSKGWNPGDYNWNTMEKFPEERKASSNKERKRNFLNHRGEAHRGSLDALDYHLQQIRNWKPKDYSQGHKKSKKN
ncbi:hypothetical protein CROQUDRAFT_54869 [Cronartium quercuum f. sp. fusiforme G11]|uniref:Uncharacterized protein n=1 Tax=Cronartium quercuum f. sp. fusiforme G11 TaxID=708437 RepID=A0A9P6T6E4_9BASI|nr:hypothetical protein CROQUDRAFT_54869 [Cronartium quercuum f. sp. fusiforme G11]